MATAKMIAKASLAYLSSQGPLERLRDPDGRTWQHAVWMLDQVLQMAESSKAHRWVGYAQALLVLHGKASLSRVRAVVRFFEEIKLLCRPQGTWADLISQIEEAKCLIEGQEEADKLMKAASYLEDVAKKVRYLAKEGKDD